MTLTLATAVSALLLGGCGGVEISAEASLADGTKTHSLTSHQTFLMPIGSTADVQSGPMRIEGQMPEAQNIEGESVYLYETEGKDRFLLDSAIISKGKYAFDLQGVEIGLYEFGTSIPYHTNGELILDPREKVLDITHAVSDFENGLDFGDSKDNAALLTYRGLESAHNTQLSNIRGLKLERSEKLRRIRARRADFKSVQDSLAVLYPDTFFANMVSHLQSPYPLDKNKFWSDLDFTDQGLIHSAVYVDRVEEYMRSHASKENTAEDKYKGFFNAVDQIASMVKAGGNDRVLEFILYTMANGFYTSNLEEVSHYVIDNYFYGDACGDSEISELFKMKAAGLRNLKIGQTPPDFILPDDKGGRLSSREVIGRSEMTLLIFWASFCHKCEEEIPILASVHRKYATRGFEVIGISVDLDNKSWKEGIKSKGAPGYNVSDLKGWAGEVAKDYRVTSTPVMFLVDKKGELLLKPERVQQLEQYLATMLN